MTNTENAPVIRPVAVGDLAKTRISGMEVRGTVVDITYPTAIIELEQGGRVSVMVDDLDEIFAIDDRVVTRSGLTGTITNIDDHMAKIELDIRHDRPGWLSLSDLRRAADAPKPVDTDRPCGRTIARREHRRTMEMSNAVAVTCTKGGIEFDIHRADVADDSPMFHRIIATLDFGDAADIHAALGEMLYGHDHTAR